MIIHLTKSKLFTVDPAKRFGKEFGVSDTVWRDCWLKYKLYHLTIPEFVEYVHFKAGCKLSIRAMRRWIVRTEIFSLAKKAFQMEATVVQSYFFEEYEGYVTEEILRNMRNGASKNSRSIV